MIKVGKINNTQGSGEGLPLANRDGNGSEKSTHTVPQRKDSKLMAGCTQGFIILYVCVYIYEIHVWNNCMYEIILNWNVCNKHRKRRHSCFRWCPAPGALCTYLNYHSPLGCKLLLLLLCLSYSLGWRLLCCSDSTHNSLRAQHLLIETMTKLTWCAFLET